MLFTSCYLQVVIFRLEEIFYTSGFFKLYERKREREGKRKREKERETEIERERER